jgi:hypothetical protein
MIIFANILAFSANFLIFCILQCRRRVILVLGITAANLASGIAFTILAIPSGAAFSYAIAVQGLANYAYVRASKRDRIPVWLALIYFAAIVAIGVYFYETPADILPAVSTAIGTFVLLMTKPTHLRLAYILCPTIWLVYTSIFFVIGSIISNSLILASNITALVRYDIIPFFKRRRKPAAPPAAEAPAA